MLKTPHQQPIQPTMPPAPWIGGKRVLAKRIISRIEEIKHTTYAEPFLGMGGIFFRRKFVPKSEAINDASGDVTNLFRILQRHYPQFMETLRFQITSRREFERLSKCLPETLTDLERAARFLYLQRLAFGGKVSGQNFGIDVTRPARFDLNKVGPMLEDIHERLSSVIIENLDWSKFIDKYDRTGTLFYIDPPYWGNEDDYGKGLFGRDQFELLAKRLAKIKGKFLLSLNDRPEVRDVFKAFDFEEVKLNYSVAGGKGTPAREVVIS